MIDFRTPYDPRDLSRMMSLQASYLRQDGLVIEARALAKRADEFGAYAMLMQDLGTLPVRSESGART
jgi:hypothetical protein